MQVRFSLWWRGLARPSQVESALLSLLTNLFLSHGGRRQSTPGQYIAGPSPTRELRWYLKPESQDPLSRTTQYSASLTFLLRARNLRMIEIICGFSVSRGS